MSIGSLSQTIFQNIISGKIDREVGIRLLEQLKLNSSGTGDYIAIIGIALKLPLADNLEEFWHNIKTGTDCVTAFPEERKRDIESYFEYTDKQGSLEFCDGAYLKDIDKFDYGFFRLSPNEASLMSPNQRLFLETAWEAIEDAGYGSRNMAGSKTGVYIGFSGDEIFDYKKMVYEWDPRLISTAMPGNLSSITASRISYLMDLRGPSLAVDTACSSSLVAVHLACQGIRNGDCHMAIAGGVRVNLVRLQGMLDLGIQAKNERTRTFDYSSTGTSSGEGVGVVLLKPLRKAIEDRNNIYTVIKGSAINQDGSSAGITAPNVSAQERVIVSAWRNAGIEPETISYMEAHGTGTALGDPIEVEGIKRAFQQYTDKKQFCAIGSVKTNIGHLDHAAGIIGLIKTVSVLRNRKIPPIVYFKRPNEKIIFEQSPVYVNDELTAIESDGHVRCGVSAFGISGTNCHVVLEEYKNEAGTAEEPEELQIFTLSAKSRPALERLISRYKGYIEKNDALNLNDICFTANTGRGHYNYRLAIIVKDSEDFKNKIRKLELDGLEFISQEGVSFGQHKIVSDSKQDKEPYEITRDEIAKLEEDLGALLEKFENEGKHTEEELIDICSLYVKGVDINWDLFYKGKKRRRVQLPTYPFERNRCWLNIPSRINKNDIFYSLKWEASALNCDTEIDGDETILVFRNQDEYSDILLNRLRNRYKRVIEVYRGLGFERVSETEFVVGSSLADYEYLISEVKHNKFSKVINLYTSESKESEIYGEGLYDGLFGLLHIVKAIGANDLDGEIDLILVSDYVSSVTGLETRINPVNSMLLGLGKVIDWEQANIRCRCIDIDSETDASLLVREIETYSGVYNTAYRNRKRYIEIVDKIDRSAEESGGINVKDGGVYVITGGLGAIGLYISEFMASKARVHLVFINRSSFPEREQWDYILKAGTDVKACSKINSINKTEKTGSTISIQRGNVADMDEMKAIFDSVRTQYGRIDGIIHSAGTGGGTLLEIEQEDNIRAVLAPKVHGTWILDKLTQQDDVDFFIMFSSAITVTGGLGGGSYTAANAYMNSFASYRLKNGKKALSLNWPVWYETGLSEGVASYEEKQMFKTIYPDKAIKGFDKAVGLGVENVILGEFNFESSLFELKDNLPFSLSDRIKSLLPKRKKKDVNKKREQLQEVSDISLKGREAGDYTDTEQKLGSIWGQVLGFKEINIYDNFYELGGDSLIATRILNFIRKEMKIVVEIADLFKNLSVFTLAQCIDEKYLNGSKVMSAYPQIVSTVKKEYYPLSHSQQRFFILYLANRDSVNYNEPSIIILEGKLDRQKFETSVQKLINRHETLRTSFGFVDEQPVQRVNDTPEFSINYMEAHETEIDSIIKDSIKPFDLGQAPLMRIKLVSVAEGRYYLIFDMHHIICDAISMHILVQDFVNIYCNGDMDALSIQYRDYTQWYNTLLESEMIKKQEAYWLQVFSDKTLPVLELPFDYPKQGNSDFNGNNITAEIDPEFCNGLKELAKGSGATIYMVLLAAYNILLSKFTLQNDIVIGIPIAGRPIPEVENLIGLFINTLALWNKPEGSKTLKQFLKEVIDNSLMAYENQGYQFDDLVDRLGVSGDSNNPIYSTMFAMHNFNISSFNVGELCFTPYNFDRNTVKFDIELSAIEFDGRLKFTFMYASSLFKNETVQELAEAYIEILRQMVRDGETRIKDIKVLEERNRLNNKLLESQKEILEDFDF